MTSLVTFLVTVTLNIFLLLDYDRVLVSLEILGLACCGFAIVNGKRSVYYTPLGAAGIMAILLGLITGMICYDSLGYFAIVYGDSRTYQNIVASTPAASVADAGRIVFSNEAVVDQSNAVGYSASDGTMYCAAPVRDLSETTNAVQFWAVGWNCCELASDFDCDAAKQADAHGGIVVLDSPSMFRESNRDWYDKARRKAEAQFNIISSSQPLYVRWVHHNDLNFLEIYYRMWAVACVIFSTICYAILCVAFAGALCKAHYYRFFCKNG